MKKYILTLAALVLGLTQVAAQKLIVDPVVEVPQGGQAKVAVKYETEGQIIKGFGISFVLPEGITTVKKTNGRPDYQIHSDYSSDSANPFGMASANDGYTGTSTDGQLQGESGTIFYALLAADESLELGTTHEVQVTKLMVTVFEDGKNKSVYLEDFKFTVKIVENVTVLDENSTEAPDAATGVDVKVLRTIKGGNWSTLCLPFDMTAEQVKKAFGDDVQLAYFDDQADPKPVSVEKEGNDITNITINFTSDDLSLGFFGNYPYLIKTSHDISEFTVEGVDVNPDAGNAVVAYTTGNARTGIHNFKFIGTLEAGTIIPNNALFLSGNSFWYSTGNTVIKGFRGYFNFPEDVLANKASNVKMQVNIDGNPTKIDDLQIAISNEGIFTIDGKKMNNDVTKLPKGVYIIDGKKVAIK